MLEMEYSSMRDVWDHLVKKVLVMISAQNVNQRTERP